MAETTHRPVLLAESLRALGCRPGGRWVDGTVGGGGHAEAILRATAPDGRLLACDRDHDAIERARRRLAPFGERVVLQHADFRALPAILDRTGFAPADGILLDLGLSAHQVGDPTRGFSFREDGPLDMRMDRTRGTTAADLVNTLSEPQLASILRRLGEEPAATRIARALVRERRRRRIETTGRLAAIIADAVGAAARRPRAAGAPRLHPATRSFQALRIAVNDELGALEAALEGSVHRLAPGGRMAVIAFHSLEDRIVKRVFRGLEARCLCPPGLPVCGCGRPGIVRAVGRRAIRPAAAESLDNPRSRSARLRVVERLGPATGGGATAAGGAAREESA
jgi:16S rRNA (cytosine1402-N4)-methyltransferase